ncbi:uncharacterized protein V6R79_024120 [Siganus canaliculatus]
MVLVLFLILLPSLTSAVPGDNSTGLEFIAAFPENIAYYHPTQSSNKVQVTALFPNTKVTFVSGSSQSVTHWLGAGETRDFSPESDLELSRRDITNRSLQISSEKLVTVQVVNLKHSSLQTALLTPSDRLATEYLIPPAPAIVGLDHGAEDSRPMAERGPFRVIIVNTGRNNQVTVDGAEPETLLLRGHQVAQVWLQEDRGLRAVRAEHPVAVYFSHTCVIRTNCTCGLLHAALSPAGTEPARFYVPPVLAQGAESTTSILLSENAMTRVVPFDPSSPLVETAGAAIFYRRGLLLPLIPESDFAACFLANSIVNVENSAVIVVHRDATEGVHVGSLPVGRADWQELESTDYVSKKVPLASGKNVIWHAFATMAVYFVGAEDGVLFGNPAATISTIPDFRGCAVTPEVVKIGAVADGWRESVKYCRDHGLELVSFADGRLQKQVYEKIVAAMEDGERQVWIGLRRSALTGDWYWLNQDPVTDTDWTPGEPGTINDGQCAALSVDSSRSVGWRDEDCCQDARPVCYAPPVLFPE